MRKLIRIINHLKNNNQLLIPESGGPHFWNGPSAQGWFAIVQHDAMFFTPYLNVGDEFNRSGEDLQVTEQNLGQYIEGNWELRDLWMCGSSEEILF